jgi:hypothetical protein
LKSFTGENAAGDGDVEKRHLGRNLAIGDHDLADLGRKLCDRCPVDDAANPAPDNRAHAHGARLAGRV